MSELPPLPQYFERPRLQAQLMRVFDRGLKQAEPFWNWGYSKLSWALPELRSGLFVIGAPENIGKCLRDQVLLASGEYRFVGDLKRDDLVVTLGARTLETRAVTALLCTGIKPTFRVTLYDGSAVVVTAEHPFLTRSGWQPISQLTVGESIAVPDRVPCGTEHRDPRELRLLGYLLGDGGLSGRNVFFTNANADILADFRACLPAGTEAVVHGCVNSCETLRVRQDELQPRAGPYQKSFLRLWCEQMGIWGKRAWEKQLPDWVYTLDREGVVQLLRGLIATDGHIRQKGKMIEYSSTSYELVRGMKRLLLRLGVRARLTLHHAARPGQRNAWRLTVGAKGNQIDRLFAELAVPGKSQGEHPCIEWLSISQIESLGEQEVFDIEVEGTHNFIGGDDIFLHNSMLLLNLGYNALLFDSRVLWMDFTLDDAVEKRIGYLIARTGEIPISSIHRALALSDIEQQARRRAFSGFLKEHGTRYHLEGFSSVPGEPSIRYTAEYVVETVARARAQRPEAKLLVTLDGFHDLQLAARFQDENDRQRQKVELLKASASREECLYLMTAQCRKDSRRRGMSPDVIKGDDTILYAADVIAHLYSDLNLNRDQALVCWHDESRPGERLPVLELDILKSKVGGFKGVLFYNYLPERCWAWEADDASQAMYRAYVLSQVSERKG